MSKARKKERSDKLLEIINFLLSEARRCRKARGYFAGCVVLGSLLETLLLSVVELYPEEVQSSKKVPMRKGEPKPLSDWTLAELLSVSKDLNWLPSRLKRDDAFDRRKAKIGDYAEIIRNTRNFVHPNRYLSDYDGKRLTSSDFDHSYEIVLLVSDWLQAKVMRSLKEHMDHEDLAGHHL
jgi:hypothetical protein